MVSELNRLACEDLILLINISCIVEKIAFGSVWNAKSPKISRKNVGNDAAALGKRQEANNLTLPGVKHQDIYMKIYAA